MLAALIDRLKGHHFTISASQDGTASLQSTLDSLTDRCGVPHDISPFEQLLWFLLLLY